MNEKILRRIEEYCEKNHLLCKGDGIVIGVSGGADSVFLLYAFVCLQEKWNLKLQAVHINHGIRGKEALRDQKYVQKITKSFSVPCIVFSENIPKRAVEWRMTEEEAGRRYRYECFEKVRTDLGYTSIAVAHHRDDQAETILFQLLRGSSLRGLGGMRPKRGNIIRPLLDVSRGEIEETLREKEIVYCNDSTNEEDDYARNLIRHHVIPYMQENLQPATISHIAKTGEHMQEVMDYVDTESEKVYRTFVRERETYSEEKRLAIDAGIFEKFHPVIQREVILRMLSQVAGKKKDITSQHIQAVSQIFEGTTGKKVDLPYQMCAEKSYDTLLVYKVTERENYRFAGYGEKICTQKSYNIPINDRKIIKVTFIEKKVSEMSVDNAKKLCTKCFDYDKMGTMPTFRYPESGDFLWLDTSGRTKKLSRLFIDEKISTAERQTMVVLAIDHHILWIPALGRCSACYYITEDTTRILGADCLE